MFDGITNCNDVNSKIWQKRILLQNIVCFCIPMEFLCDKAKISSFFIKEYLIGTRGFDFFLNPSELKKHASTAVTAVALSPFSELRNEKLLPLWTIKYLELWTIVRFSYARVAILQHNRVSSWIYVYTQNVEIAYSDSVVCKCVKHSIHMLNWLWNTKILPFHRAPPSPSPVVTARARLFQM